MSRVRFATTEAVFESFPELAEKITAAPGSDAPVDFLRKLAADSEIGDAVTFCAYLLPRREAVWWACGCLRMLSDNLVKDQAAGLLAAEAWVYKPDDGHRRAALDIGTTGDPKDAMTWLAWAAGSSSGCLAAKLPGRQGSQIQAGETRQVHPCMTARAVRIAVLFGIARIGGEKRLERIHACLAEGIRLVEEGLS